MLRESNGSQMRQQSVELNKKKEVPHLKTESWLSLGVQGSEF